jgi:hypothetical protein
MCRILGLFFLFLVHLKICAYEIVIVSMFRNCAPYIREWVSYHHMIGVDHFWLYDDESEDNWAESLKDYIDAGIVEVFYWPGGRPDWTAAQMRAFHDGLERGVGVAKWVALLDQDEFIVPMQDRSLPECLQNHFSNAGAVYMNWRHFGTSHVTLAPGESLLARLTSCSEREHSRNAVGKSILRPECADISQLWTQHFCLLKPGYTYVNGDGEHTINFERSDLWTDGKIHDQFIRVNHYSHRDEAFFYRDRIYRDAGNIQLQLDHYEDFNKTQDRAILELIEKYQ